MKFTKRSITFIGIFLISIILIIGVVIFTNNGKSLQGLLIKKPIQVELSKTDCNQKNFKAAFILLYRDPSELTEERIEKFDRIKRELPDAFNYATYGKANMNVRNEVVNMYVDSDDLVWENNNDTPTITTSSTFSKDLINMDGDIYDFIIFGTTFDVYPYYSYNLLITQNILNIGSDIITPLAQYGSNGKLKSIVTLSNLNGLLFSNDTSPVSLLLHEIGHQWCCYVGDNFSGESSILGIIDDNAIHFYPGLESGNTLTDPMLSSHFVPNESYTNRNYHAVYDYSLKRRYHPFMLYFMGLMPKAEYSKQYPLYDVGYDPNGDYFPHDMNNAKFVKNVSVNDIIAVEGERQCR